MWTQFAQSARNTEIVRIEIYLSGVVKSETRRKSYGVVCQSEDLKSVVARVCVVYYWIRTGDQLSLLTQQVKSRPHQIVAYYGGYLW